jgi:trans-AT polyketide synthase/acyltransferase/oxidoreductase domain-containing protein
VIPAEVQILAAPPNLKAVELKAVEGTKTLQVQDLPAPLPSDRWQIQASTLGDAGFQRDWGIRMSYLTGSMYRGIASADLVVALGRAGLMGFLGTGGMSMDQVRDQLRAIKSRLDAKASWGANLLCNIDRPEVELQTVDLFCREGVRRLEASAFMQVTPALSLWRALGMRQDSTGHIHCDHQVLAKLSRPEVARMFMNPTPQEHLERWLREGRITSEQARLAGMVPVSNDICVEADSGGHTDQGVAFALLPSIQSLRDAVMAQRGYSGPIRVGLAGGIGTPQAVAAAFAMKADFVMTGSINQCTVEAGTSDAVKDLLQDIDVQDTDYAPAGDMFELGARVQVLRKGVFFPARANKLYMLYTHYDSLEEIPALIRGQIEQKYFKRSFDSIWQETRDYLIAKGRTAQLEAAEKSSKARMALVFRWYFRYSGEVAMQGQQEHRVDFQVHTGPAMGAFNQWVKGTALADWRMRHVVDIADRLMDGAAALLCEQMHAWRASPAPATKQTVFGQPPTEPIQMPRT